MVISKHFLCKDLVHHPIETTNKKWLFRVPGRDSHPPKQLEPEDSNLPKIGKGEELIDPAYLEMFSLIDLGKL